MKSETGKAHGYNTYYIKKVNEINLRRRLYKKNLKKIWYDIGKVERLLTKTYHKILIDSIVKNVLGMTII